MPLAERGIYQTSVVKDRPVFGNLMKLYSRIREMSISFTGPMANFWNIKIYLDVISYLLSKKIPFDHTSFSCGLAGFFAKVFGAICYFHLDELTNCFLRFFRKAHVVVFADDSSERP